MKRRSITATVLVLFCVTTNPLWAQRDGGQRGGDDESSSEVAEKSFHETVLLDLAAWRHDDARTLMEDQRGKFGKSTGYDVAWALMLAQERKLETATSKLDTATKENVLDPSAPYFLGEIQSWQKKEDPAKTAWMQARDRAKAILKEDTKNGWAFYWQGAAQVRLGQYAEAKDVLKKALKYDADRAMTEFQLGLALMYLERWDDARKAFNKCLKADSAFSHGYYYRGRVLQKLKKTEEMLLDMDRFLQLAPDAREANAAKSILRAGG